MVVTGTIYAANAGVATTVHPITTANKENQRSKFGFVNASVGIRVGRDLGAFILAAITASGATDFRLG